MCLTNLLSKKELKKFKGRLPAVFSVWKIMRGSNGACEYLGTRGDIDLNEQKLDKKGVYYARNCPTLRMSIQYKPGFHAFLSQTDANNYNRGLKIRTMVKFQAKRAWVKQVGKTNQSDIQSVVLSRIEVV